MSEAIVSMVRPLSSVFLIRGISSVISHGINQSSIFVKGLISFPKQLMANAGMATLSFAPGIGILHGVSKLGKFCLLMEIYGLLIVNEYKFIFFTFSNAKHG